MDNEQPNEGASATTTTLVLRPPSMPMPPEVANEFDLTNTEWRVLVDQIFPSAQSSEAVHMALSYCRARKLDIYKRPVHIVPMYSTALKRWVETVWPGIAEIRTTAARTGEYAGIDEVAFGPMIELEFKGIKEIWEKKRKIGEEEVKRVVRYPEWASVVVYRRVQGHREAFHTKIFWEETYASKGKTGIPNDMWAKRPRGQIDKCVEAAGLRKAFPEEVGGMYAAEEMEGRVIEHDEARQTAEGPIKVPPPLPAGGEQPPRGTVVDAEVEEIDDKKSAGDATADEWPLDDTEYFTMLEQKLDGCADMPALEEVWNSADPGARFTNSPTGDTSIGIATSIRKQAEKRIAKAAAK